MSWLDTAGKLTESTPAEVLVTVGAVVGLLGATVLPGGEDGKSLLRVAIDGGEVTADEQLAPIGGHRMRAQGAGARLGGAHIGVGGPVPQRPVAELLVQQVPGDPATTRCVHLREPAWNVGAVVGVGALEQEPVDHLDRLGSAQAVVLPQQLVTAAQADREVPVEAAATVAFSGR